MTREKSTITMVNALDVMCQVVAEFGVDFVYQKIETANDGGDGGSCVNWDSEKWCPSCLIGHVMFRLGASAELLSLHTRDGAASLIRYFGRHSGLIIEEGVAEILAAAQIAQDQGETWGHALHEALATHVEVLKRQFIEKATAV
jgi:hypothetical protein